MCKEAQTARTSSGDAARWPSCLGGAAIHLARHHLIELSEVLFDAVGEALAPGPADAEQDHGLRRGEGTRADEQQRHHERRT